MNKLFSDSDKSRDTNVQPANIIITGPPRDGKSILMMTFLKEFRVQSEDGENHE